jgi:hypothetical protein
MMEKKVRGIMSLLSLGYRAGSTNLQSWYRITGEDSIKPKTTDIFRSIKSGSVGDRVISSTFG